MVKNGDTVHVHYTGTLDNGTQFDSSAGREPLSFVAGSGQVIGGFDEAVMGMQPGEKKTFRIEPANAYGPANAELVQKISRAGAPEGLEVGDRVQFKDGREAVISTIDTESITIDSNHPLAGQALTFAVELVRID